MSKVLDFINAYRSSNPTGWRNWLIGIAVSLVTLSLGMVFAIRTYFSQREIAKLKHERDVLIEKAHKSHVDVSLSASRAERDQHERLATEALKRAAEAHRKVIVIEYDNATAINKINKLKSWADMDAFVD